MSKLPDAEFLQSLRNRVDDLRFLNDDRGRILAKTRDLPSAELTENSKEIIAAAALVTRGDALRMCKIDRPNWGKWDRLGLIAKIALGWRIDLDNQELVWFSENLRILLDMSGGADNAGRRAMRVDEANETATKLAKTMGDQFFLMSRREQAKHIGCHRKTWERTPLYKTALKRGKIKAPKPKAPRTVSLTSEIERATGEGEPEQVLLETLVREQRSDDEMAPLKHDPHRQRKKLHYRKRL